MRSIAGSFLFSGDDVEKKVGVLSGGFAQRELESAGCVAIYQDVGELLERLQNSPLAPEPVIHEKR